MNEPASASAEGSHQLARLRHEAADARERSRRSAERAIQVEQALASERARTLFLERSLGEQKELAGELSGRLQRAEAVTSAMKRSLSWRVTGPLRALKRRG